LGDDLCAELYMLYSNTLKKNDIRYTMGCPSNI